MNVMVKRIFSFIFCIFLLFAIVFVVSADELDDITKQLDSLKKDLQDKEANFQNLNKQLDDIKSRVAFVESEIVKKEKEVRLGEAALSYQRDLLNERARSYYKNINKNAISIINLLTSENLSLSLRNFFYQKTVVDQDRNAITKIVLYIKNLEQKKAELESENSKLVIINKEIDRQSQILAGEISTTRAKVVELTVRQQQLIASRIAGLNISRSAGSAIECVDDRKLDPGFGSAFAFYTYGIPHRVGLNQYGAKGRADAGQMYEAILRAYYNFDNLQKFDPNTEVKVQGNGPFSLEEYTLRIYEVPESWPIESLKAQAIAARSFALRYVSDRRNAGQSDEICTSQDCQVFQSNPKTGQWVQAVRDTEGMVMVQGDQPIKAWFSSTFGGYAHTSGEVWGGERSWTKNFADTSSGVGNFSDLQSNAWDKESKCFYTAQGSRSEYGKSAWLKPSEVADIVNTLLLLQRDSSVSEHLYQLDKSNPAGTDNWDEERVKAELKKYRNPFSSVSNVSIGADFNGGRTTSVTIAGDAESTTFNGDEFKSRFNLRAPTNISIVGPLYSVEKR